MSDGRGNGKKTLKSTPLTGPELSRRGFLQGMGAAAGAATLTTSAPAQEAAPQIEGLRFLGRNARPLKLRINGAERDLTVEPRTTLLSALRDQLDLTGAKEVCGRGACGGCTVLLDGVAVNGCMTLALDAVGHEVTTIEGLAADPACAAFFDAMCKHDAAQCGFCIPGFMVRAWEVLQDNPRPTPEQLRAGLSGNICRCGTYTKIFDGALEASGQPVTPIVENHVALENVGPRLEIREKVTGAAKYTADILKPNTLFAKFVRFPLGAGRVTGADVAAARAVPGIVEVEFDDSEDATYVGQRLGHVAGDSLDAVEDAIEALNMRVRAGAPRTNPHEFYDGPPESPQDGELATLFGSAASVVEATYTTEVQTHSSLETHGGFVEYRGDSAEVWGSTQACQGYREGIARPLGLSESNVTFHCEHVGGGFGSKFSPGAEGNLAAALSKKFNRPCRVMLDRREEHLDTGNRPGSIQFMRVGVDGEGKILGARIHCASTVGHQSGGGGVRNPMVYGFGTVARTEEEISLSAGLPAAFRAPGCPQGCFAVESMMDELAKSAGLDPMEFRRVNASRSRTVPQLERGAALIGWDRRRPDGTWPGRVKSGFGVACAHWGVFGRGCQIDVDITRDGRVEVRSGAQDIGTGARTVIVDMARSVLGCDRALMTGKIGNSAYPPGPASGGSVTTRLISTTSRIAARNALNELKAEVAEAWGVPADRVMAESGVFTEQGGNRRASWEDACAMIRADRIAAHGSFDADEAASGDEKTDACQFAEVEVDTETGVVRVKRIVAIQACGLAVNRLTVENQICGGVIQGLSFALFEQRVLDGPTGGMLNPNLEWYKIAGSADIPEIVPVIDVDEGDLNTRPIGEPTTIPTSGAIANAVANAIGAPVRSLPITPERVLAALREGGRT
jgi:xanthine dehydrogenase YagR molybdenum-binding subunit